MNRTLLTAFVLTASFGAARAESLDAAARARAAHAGGAPGTVGAMEAMVQGLATSPDDVVAQQAGPGTAAEGGGHGTTSAAGYAPGTVGATPGNDRAR